MNFKLNALVAAALLVAAGSANAAIDGAQSGNGSLLLNLISQGGTSATAGGDDTSALFDLGVNMDTVLTWNGVAGFTRTWNLTSGAVTGTGIVGSSAVGSYGSTWSTLVASQGVDTAIEFNVIALDGTDKANFAGGSRYLSTGDTSFATTSNANLNGFDGMDLLVNANQTRGTHGSAFNGASTATPVDASNSYFRAVNGLTQGDTWLQKTTEDTTKTLATAQQFWFLTTLAPGGTQASSKAAFGVDLNGNGSIGTGEFSLWTADLSAGTVTFANPVPEASTYGMMLAGLGLVGFMARRRMNRVA